MPQTISDNPFYQLYQKLRADPNKFDGDVWHQMREALEYSGGVGLAVFADIDSALETFESELDPENPDYMSELLWLRPSWAKPDAGDRDDVIDDLTWTTQMRELVDTERGPEWWHEPAKSAAQQDWPDSVFNWFRDVERDLLAFGMLKMLREKRDASAA